jgi:hypothetical protein
MFQDSETRINPIADFGNAGLHPAMLRNVQLAGYEAPTPIQKYCIPAVGMGYDVIAVAQTGQSNCPYLHLFLKTKYLSRFRQDGRLSDSHPEQAHGQGEEVGSTSPKPSHISAWHRSTSAS